MPTKVYWRPFNQANFFADRRPQAQSLVRDSSFEIGARCFVAVDSKARPRE
jgi:hypothetical protein